MINDTTYATVDEAPPSGLAWRVKRIHHLTGEQNKGKHNIFLRVYRAGEIIRDGSVVIRWGWEGQQANEISNPVSCKKNAPDPSCDIPIEKGQRIWIKVDDGKGTPTDIVRNLHAMMDVDSVGNFWGHHSTDVDFEITIIAPPVVIDNPPTIPTTGTWQEAVAVLAHRVKLIEDVINAKG